jgi:tryptophan synthase alpha chain
MSDPIGHRYAAAFATLASREETAFIPFTMLGDPDPARSAAVLDSLVAGGADALELGFPFSDPVADGPVIQAAGVRALEAGTHQDDCWALIAAVRARASELPIGLLVYANLVVRRGTETFYRQAAESGVDSVLVADAPLLEIAPFQAVARDHGIATVLIAPPTADQARLERLAATSEGYTYVVTRAGVTGVDTELHEESAGLVATLRQAGAPPPVLGFGISTPEHVRTAARLGASGAISGSAVVRQVAALAEGADQATTLDAIRAFVHSMKSATRKAPA